MIDNVEYIKVKIPIRYGDEDMPYKMPFREGDTFEITYNINDGNILEFNKDLIDINYITSWNIVKDRVDKDKLLNLKVFILNHIKVCDEGCYYLLNKDLNTLYSLEREYVPDSYSVDGEYGDYINLHLDLENGKIINLKKNATFKEFLENAI